jgi:hypothetical protein
VLHTYTRRAVWSLCGRGRSGSGLGFTRRVLTDRVLAVALRASKAAEILGPSTRAQTIADSLANVYGDLSSRLPLRIDYIEETYFPNTPETKVPLAISLALITESAESTALIAANIGGDSDSVASIGGAVAAALRPETVNESWFDVVRTINQDDIVEVALSLAVLRTMISGT